MKNANFVHLHVHTSFSLLDGLGKIDQYVKKASELGFTHLAITDHGNINGAIKFQKACTQYGIKSLVGCELYITEDATVKSKDNGHMLVLVKNEQGWQNLLKMLSYAHLTGFFYKPRISYDTILNHSEGLIITSACAHSWLFQSSGRKLLCNLLDKKSNEDLYFEVMPHDDSMTNEANSKFIRLSNKFDIPLIATNDCHYVNEEDADAHEVLLAIQRGAKWDDHNRWRFGVKTLHLQSADEMVSSFEKQDAIDSKVYLRAIRNTMEVALSCEDFRIEEKKPRLPRVRGIKKEDEEAKLRDLCSRGFIEKIGEFMPVEYETRLEYEISVLKSKGAIRYFLLVWDLVNWCRENDILCSSRGSVGCALTAFLMNLTEIDPIQYHLPFSRFLNEERIDLPDIDIDTVDNKRHLVTQRLHKLYGENNVAGISTFNRMKARGVIRDVARVFDIDLPEVDSFAKLIDSSIDDALETEEGKEFARKYPKIIKYAQILENTEKSLGRHAAGKIISSEDLTLGTRAYLCMREDELTVNWEGEDCEHQGLIKLDILGLNTLTVIAETITLIKKNQNKIVNFFKIPMKDPIIFKELSDGRFSGIFQMGYAVRNLVGEMGIESILDWSDAIALARPGPLDSGMAEEYVRRKHGAKWERKNELYEEILKDTYSIISYQEQIMNIIHKVAGLSYATADKIRKIIGKKRDVKEFEPFRKAFIKGCLQNDTLSQDEAEEFWEGLLKHSRYSFNKSHSLSYAYLGYKCLWLLHYFPLEFICAALSYGTDKIKEEMLAEAHKINIKIVPPKYGISDAKEWVVQNNKLYAPYVMIKGIGEKLAEEIRVEPSKTKKGFFSTNNSIELKPKVRSILETINAFDLDSDDLPNEASIYFDINFGNYTSHDDLFIQKQDPFEINEDLSECVLCELRNLPVPPSPSKYNLMILGESPGCISGDSLIEVAYRDKNIYPNGIPIRDLVGKDNLLVYSFDTKLQKLVINKVINIWCSGIKPVYKVTYEWWFNKPNSATIRKSASIKVTKNHPFLLKRYKAYDPFSSNNSSYDEYLSIEDGLSIGHGLQPFYRRVQSGYSLIGFTSKAFKESRFLLEYKVGRPLKEREQCHHKNGNKLDDSWNNLDLQTIESHSSIHSSGENNCMNNKDVRRKHLETMQSEGYRSKMSSILKSVLQNPIIYQQRLEQIDKYKHKIQKTLVEKYKDPLFYLNYLKSRRFRNGRRLNKDEIDKHMIKKFGFTINDDNHIITKIEYIGYEEVYDMEVEKYSNFVANEIIVHNSHEAKHGKGFIGKSGKLLWSELAKHKLLRSHFHVTNAIKCSPKSKANLEKSADVCFKWLEEEINFVKPAIILALGNIAMYSLKGESKGILKRSGTIEWSSRFNCFVVYCVHPALVLRNPNYSDLFSKSIGILANKVKEISS